MVMATKYYYNNSSKHNHINLPKNNVCFDELLQ